MNDNRTMKDYPESERPYEKCMKLGAGALSDAELLAVVLRCGLPGEPVSQLSARLLMDLEDRGGLSALGELSVPELCRIRGIGKVRAVQLVSVAELARRITGRRSPDTVRMTSPESVAEYFMEDLGSRKQEVVTAAFFNTRGRLLHASEITRGTVNASVITPREIFLEALRYQAVSLILLHNHPSGDPTPSREDLLLTDRMVSCGQMMSVPLLDHIIIGDHCYTSLKEQGYIL